MKKLFVSLSLVCASFVIFSPSTNIQAMQTPNNNEKYLFDADEAFSHNKPTDFILDTNIQAMKTSQLKQQEYEKNLTSTIKKLNDMPTPKGFDHLSEVSTKIALFYVDKEKDKSQEAAVFRALYPNIANSLYHKENDAYSRFLLKTLLSPELKGLMILLIRNEKGAADTITYALSIFAWRGYDRGVQELLNNNTFFWLLTKANIQDALESAENTENELNIKSIISQAITQKSKQYKELEQEFKSPKKCTNYSEYNTQQIKFNPEILPRTGFQRNICVTELVKRLEEFSEIVK